MSPLPRGTCPRCRQDVALRTSGVTREHRVTTQFATHVLGLPFNEICPGSAEPALEPRVWNEAAGTWIPEGATA